MQQDLGLTRAEATTRLKAETTARTVERAARRAAGASYGGSWFDAERGGLTVAVSDSSRSRAVAATGARVAVVRHSERQLDATMDRLDALDAPSGVSSWHVDPQSSSVVVSVVAARQDDNDVQAFVSRARKAGPVTVRETRQAPRTFAAGRWAATRTTRATSAVPSASPCTGAS
jgi:hypothetical protein